MLIYYYKYGVGFRDEENVKGVKIFTIEIGISKNPGLEPRYDVTREKSVECILGSWFGQPRWKFVMDLMLVHGEKTTMVGPRVVVVENGPSNVPVVWTRRTETGKGEIE